MGLSKCQAVCEVLYMCYNTIYWYNLQQIQEEGNIIIPILQIHKQAKGGYIPVQGHTEGKWWLKPESGLPRFAFLLSLLPDLWNLRACEIYVFDRQTCRQPAVKCNARSRLSELITINYSRKQRKTRQVDPCSRSQREVLPWTLLQRAQTLPNTTRSKRILFHFLHLHRAS